MSLPVITLDVDWAPDFVIDEVASLLINDGVRATWFITHASPAIERLKDYPDLFELGIHPNFQPGSTHGSTPEEVLDHMGELVPSPSSVRTHALVQSTPLLAQMFRRFPSLKADLSLFLPHSTRCEFSLFAHGGSLVTRIPYIWEDDLEMDFPEQVWRLEGLDRCKGLRVFDFHPIHIILNDPSMNSYIKLKSLGKPLRELGDSEVNQFRQTCDGPRSMFEDAIAILKSSGGGKRVVDLIDI